jgi:hypothetical protein
MSNLQLQEILKPELEKLINQSKDALGEIKRVALGQAWKILQTTVASVVQQIEINAGSLEGKDKKTVALDLLSQFYDKVFLIVDIPFVPAFLEPIIRSSVKNILMVLVGASIDAIVTTFKQVGIFTK